MAHFASINSEKIVRRIVRIGNGDVDANGGDQSEQAAEHVKTIVPLIKDEVKFVQTSYNSNFRKTFATINSKYDSDDDIFTPGPGFASWVYDESQKTYLPPVARPTNGDDGTIDLRFKDTNITSMADGEGNTVDFPNGYPLPIEYHDGKATWACYDSVDVARYWNPDNQTWET